MIERAAAALFDLERRRMMEERMLTFIHSFDSEKPAYLDALERYAKETNVPIIRPQMQSLLRLLVTVGASCANPGGWDGNRVFGAADE